MCVIICGRRTKPSLEMLNKCENANGDGIGVAWAGDDGLAHYRKGIKVDEAHALIQAAPRDWVAHFRLATVGGDGDLLCHPFPVEKDATLAVEGSSKYLLFHNGHWSSWELSVDKVEVAINEERPRGIWSDSRGVAWMAHHAGKAILNLVPGKYALLGPGGWIIFPLNRTSWDHKHGMWFSNLSWEAWSGATRRSDYRKGFGGYLTQGSGANGAFDETFEDRWQQVGTSKWKLRTDLEREKLAASRKADTETIYD
jgi:hypothetical protein